MKKIFKYLSILLTVALLGSFTACNLLQEPLEESAEVGLGIKVFFPTKVVAGQPMTINGSGFAGVKEIVFPGDVVVTDFELVSGEMIRVNAPAGIAADGGMIKVVAEDGEAVSRVPLTLGSTSVSGFSRPEGSTFTGGENLEIYGSDLQFICEVEVPDPDGNPMILGDECFYRKGENKVVITLPKKVFKGSYVGKVRTFDGKEFLLPEYVYEPGAEGGHWEKKKVFIWQNPDPAGLGNANWNGLYRFCLEGKDTNPAGKECIAEIPAETWEKMKTEKFYITFSHDDWFQVRIVTGWWNFQWPEGKEKDITPSYLTDMLIDNGDGTYTVELDLKDSELAANIDVEHLLFTGSGYTPLELYFEEDVWVGGGGHMEIVKTHIWKNADPAGLGNANWNGLYRFCLEGKDTNPAGKECIAEIPAETWEKMKTEKFYITFSHDDWFQVRIVTGWWNFQWPEGKEKDITPSYLTDMLIDNGDGTYTVELDLKDSELAANIDVEHLLFTGSGYTPLELYFQEEVWVGGESGPKEVDIWKNADPAGLGNANWNGLYRFCLEGKDTNPAGKECIAEIPAETWEKMKTEKFYITFSHDDWFQVRIVTGWWNCQWPEGKEKDITPSYLTDMLIDNGDGTYSVEINLKDTELAASMDVEHLLFTGSGYTPLRLYYIE